MGKEEIRRYAVLCQVRGMAGMLAEERSIRKKVKAQKDDRKAVLETMIGDSAKEMARWKDGQCKGVHA